MEPARKFKIIVNSKECGTCSGPTPSAVAKKVVKKLCGNSSKVVKFSLKECKRGSERMCGPYQGRMEKLDRPFKRDGKKITHRVVCGKVRKMRGGRELVAEDFEIKEDDGDFKFDRIGLRPHIFFGEVIELNNKRYYSLVVFNNEHFGGNEKTCGFNKLIIDNETITVKNFGGRNNNINKDINKDILFSLLENLLYCKKLTEYKTIRRKIYLLLTSYDKLYEKLNIPHDFFERDYLPEVITAEGGCVPKGFYMNLPKSINSFKLNEGMIPKEVIAETTASKRPNFFKRKVYYTYLDMHKYIYFSKKKDSEYYNIAVICNENDTIYIGIYYPKKKVVKFYPIDKDIFRRFIYPSDFIDLIYLYYPYIDNRYTTYDEAHIKCIIKVLQFYAEYISSKIKIKNKNDIDIYQYINQLQQKINNSKKRNQNTKTIIVRKEKNEEERVRRIAQGFNYENNKNN